MKSFIILLVVICICNVSFNDLRAETVVLDRIVAVVNDEIITQADLDKFKNILYVGAEQKPSGMQADMQLLNQMVEKRVMLQEAKVLGIEVTEVQLQRAVDDIVRKNNSTLEKFKEMVTQGGITFDDYCDLYKTELIQSQLISQKVQAKISITDQEVEEYYNEEIKPDEKAGARVRIQQILFGVLKDASPEDVAVIEKRAAEVLKGLREGEPFEKMAVTYSQGPAAKTGGDIGYFHRGEILPEIEKAAFGMEVGETSPVIRTIFGFHIIKLIDKDLTDKDRSWKDHEIDIKNILYGRKYEETFKRWIEGLKSKSYIKIKY